MYKIKALFGIVVMTLFLILSCKTDQGAEEAETSEDTVSANEAIDEVSTSNEVSDTQQIQFDKIIANNVPYVLKIIAELESTGAKYHTELFHDPQFADKYSTADKQALNLGVYGVDLGYAMIYEQLKEGRDYLDASKKLSDKLGIGSVYTVNRLQRFENNISNKDSMMVILYDTYDDIDKYLRSNERMKTAVLVLFGSWIEGMYFALHTMKNEPQEVNEEVSKRLWEQKVVLENLEEVMIDYKDDPTVSDLLARLQKVRMFYEDKKMKDHRITPEHAAEMLPTIEEFRRKIIEP